MESSSLGRQSRGSRLSQELGQPRRFRHRDLAAETGDAVVPPADIVVFGVWALGQFFDQSILQHSLDRTIEGAGTHFQLSVRSCSDVLHDGVSVALAVGNSYQDVEEGGG